MRVFVVVCFNVIIFIAVIMSQPELQFWSSSDQYGLSEVAVGMKNSSLICDVSSPAEQTNITAEPGKTVSLPCRAPDDKPILAVQWNRTDLKFEEYVLSYRDNKSDKEKQHPSFQNRADLQNREMKDGDVSLLLKNVTSDDAKTYECRVFQRGAEKARAIESIESIFTVHLEVSPPPGMKQHKDGRKQAGQIRGHDGLIAGLTAAGIIVMVVGVWIYKKKKKSAPPQSDNV